MSQIVTKDLKTDLNHCLTAKSFSARWNPSIMSLRSMRWRDQIKIGMSTADSAKSGCGSRGQDLSKSRQWKHCKVDFDFPNTRQMRSSISQSYSEGRKLKENSPHDSQSKNSSTSLGMLADASPKWHNLLYSWRGEHTAEITTRPGTSPNAKKKVTSR